MQKPPPRARPRYRSGFEARVAAAMARQRQAHEYEPGTIPYTRPASAHKYTPDFLLPNNVIIELKGHLTLRDRQKHLLIKAQHPDLDIRFVFMDARKRLSPRSPTTYADWARKHGFLFAEGTIPAEWFD